jgi:hypothetical protein
VVESWQEFLTFGKRLKDLANKGLTLIGVISRDSETPAVAEFFQLFKTPWEFYNAGHSYDVIISTQNQRMDWKAKLVLIYSSEPGAIDSATKLAIGDQCRNLTLAWNGVEFPVYGNTLTFDEKCKSIIGIKGNSKSAGVEIDVEGTKVVRLGFDLFEEVFSLLSSGQPVEFAAIPTLEIHISILRKLMLEAGIAFVEIPPIPEGYRFMVCLTHDVDFLGIREHKFDRSALGFIWRVFSPYSLRDFRSKISWQKAMQNLKSLILLPGVYLGVFRDFWFQLDRYMAIEKDMCSTFFLIPFKDFAGSIDPDQKNPPMIRASKYEITGYRIPIKSLLEKGREIGVHGLDAWHDSQKGLEEREKIGQLAGDGDMGVRMHWLYFSRNSPKTLEEAGFCYDSSLGYNDGVGFRSGTTQVFRLPGTSNLFELSLNIQDTAMFYKKRMKLSEAEAMPLCKELIDKMRAYGGVLTINWHQRSLGPERNWDYFYAELLRLLKEENACFLTAKQAVNWFKNRREARFDWVEFTGGRFRIRIAGKNGNDSPRMMLRIHDSLTNLAKGEGIPWCKQSYTDIPWSGEEEIKFSLRPQNET